MAEIKPITPAEAKQKMLASIKPEVIQAVNELLAEKFCEDSSIIIYQRDIVDRATKIMYGEQVGDAMTGAFDFKWLNFEDRFRSAGWEVRYVKPDWTEKEKPHFVFTAKKTRSRA